MINISQIFVKPVREMDEIMWILKDNRCLNMNKAEYFSRDENNEKEISIDFDDNVKYLYFKSKEDRDKAFDEMVRHVNCEVIIGLDQKEDNDE